MFFLKWDPNKVHNFIWLIWLKSLLIIGFPSVSFLPRYSLFPMQYIDKMGHFSCTTSHSLELLISSMCCCLTYYSVPVFENIWQDLEVWSDSGLIMWQQSSFTGGGVYCHHQAFNCLLIFFDNVSGHQWSSMVDPLFY